MPLIKQFGRSDLAKSALVLDLGDLKRQAQEIIDAGRRDAEQIRRSAERTAQALVDAADERGYRAGFDRAMAEGRAKGETEGRASGQRERGEAIDALVDEWSAALERWDAERREMLVAAREDVLVLAVALARKIVLRVPELDPSVVQDQLAEALTLMGRPSSLTVTVNPSDRPLIDEVLPALTNRLLATAHASIEEDAAITPGGCIVRTGRGSIDATLDRQLDRIARALLPPPPAADAEAGP